MLVIILVINLCNKLTINILLSIRPLTAIISDTDGLNLMISFLLYWVGRGGGVKAHFQLSGLRYIK